MGFTPQQVNAMTPWQFSACVEGWITANVPEQDTGLSSAEYDAASALLDKMIG